VKVLKRMLSTFIILLVIVSVIPIFNVEVSMDVARRHAYLDRVKVLVLVNKKTDLSILREIRKIYNRRLLKARDVLDVDKLLDQYRRDVYAMFVNTFREVMGKIEELIIELGGYVGHHIYTIGAISAYVPKDCVNMLRRHPLVRQIIKIPKFRVDMDTAPYSILADTFWTRGYTGQGNISDKTLGVEVAIVDTGVDVECDYLSGRIIDAKSFVAGEGVDDLFGHGTMVANIVAGNHPTYRGVAYGANIINAKAMNRNGEGDMDDVMAAIEWAVTQATDTAEIINLSLGAPKDEDAGLIPDGSTIITRFIDYIAFVYDVLPVIAVGNYEAGYRGVNIPADAFNAIAVGALNDGGNVDRSDDVLWSGSCYGPTDDGRIKPDVVAPGQYITTIGLNNLVETGSGTSFAAPMVSGSSALILEYLIRKMGLIDNMSLILKAILVNSADYWDTDGPGTSITNETGFGYINLENAYDHAGNVYLMHMIMGNTMEYRVNLSSGEKLYLTLAWWRTPNDTYTFYRIGKFSIEVHNSTGDTVYKYVSKKDNIVKLEITSNIDDEYTITITKLNETDSPLVDDVVIVASKPLLREAKTISICLNIPLNVNDSVHDLGTITIKNNGKDAIGDVTIDITSNKINFTGIPLSLNSLQPNERETISLNVSFKGVGTDFLIISVDYKIGTEEYEEFNGTVTVILDDDDDEPYISNVDVGVSLIERKIRIHVDANDTSGIDRVMFYWRLKYPIDILRLDLADGCIELQYDESKDIWHGEINIEMEWENKELYFLVIVYDADKDWNGDQKYSYATGSVKIGSIKLMYALLGIVILLIIVIIISYVRKTRRKTEY